MSAGDEAIALLEQCFVERVGISINRGGHRPLIERVLQSRMQAVAAPSLEAYLRLLTAPDQLEFQRLVDAATVGLTWFFRDPEQLEAFAELLRHELAGRPLRVWVAGCSTGEEVYSLAMVAQGLGADVHILGTDVNEQALSRARAGHYSAWSARSLPDAQRRWLVPAPDGGFEVAWELRRRTSFLRHSLVEAPPASPHAAGDARRWDVIFCRNVLIYFHPRSLVLAFANLQRALGDDGWLFLGASEMVMPPPSLQLVPVGPRHALKRASGARPPVPVPPPAPMVNAPPVNRPPPQMSRIRDIQPSDISPTSISDAKLSVPQLFSRAYASYSADKLDEAMQRFAEVLALDPLFAEARLLLGIAYYRSGDFDDAIAALTAALFLCPELWPASFYLGLSHEAHGDPRAAEPCFRRVVATAERMLPLSIAGELRDELEAWKPDVVASARRHLRNMARTD